MTSTETPNPTTLAAANTGDTVMLMTGWSDAKPVKVTKVTPKQIHVGGAKYYKEDGRRVGDRHGNRIRPVVDGELERIEHKKVAEALIRRIVAIVDSPSGSERQSNHAKLVAGPIENLEQALALLADSIRDDNEDQS